MTFPLGRAASHPSLARRPEHTSNHVRMAVAPRVDPRIRIFGEWPGAHRYVWRVSTTSDRLHVRKLCNEKVIGAFRFAHEDVEALESAIVSSKMPGRTRCIRSIPLKSGGWIDVGVAPGVVLLRIRFEVGDAGESKGHLHARIEGMALVAFAFAVSEFKKATAAKAAL